MTSHYRSQGIPLTCKHCGKDEFTRHASKIDGWVDLLSGLVSIENDRRVNVFACNACGSLQWFLPLATALPLGAGQEVSEDVACLECGTIISCEDPACPSCGWSWSTPPA